MRVTVKKLIEALKRLDKCENMAQVCFVFDTLPKEIKRLIEEE
jgi:hypothetical protein